VGHDPTDLNGQGPAEGTQYRSVNLYASEEQQPIGRAYIDQLDQANVFSHKIVIQLVPLKGFYPAEGYHQDYVICNPNSLYIRINDLPKVDLLREQLFDLNVMNR
jgi:peptide-methionine (S)-S-oxide reductase